LNDEVIRFTAVIVLLHIMLRNMMCNKIYVALSKYSKVVDID